MKQIITEEMRYRKQVVEYAQKHDNNAKAAQRYHTSRQNVQRWRKRYDGTWDSLRNKSRRPHSHPNQHTPDELTLIQRKYRRFKHEGLAEVYVQCRQAGYTRTYESMCKQIRQRGWNKTTEPPKRSNPKTKWRPDPVTYPGEKVQIDIKYVPLSCLLFDTKGKRYYQITALDEYSRMRVCQIVDEKSVTNTALFLLVLEEAFGFAIDCVQTDNGMEFTCSPEEGAKQSIFEEILESKGIRYKKTRPYSPWQNGKVERSHRLDDERFYSRRVFHSVEEFIKAHQRYIRRGNNVHRKVLNFLSPNEVVERYFASQSA